MRKFLLITSVSISAFLFFRFPVYAETVALTQLTQTDLSPFTKTATFRFNYGTTASNVNAIVAKISAGSGTTYVSVLATTPQTSAVCIPVGGVAEYKIVFSTTLTRAALFEFNGWDNLTNCNAQTTTGNKTFALYGVNNQTEYPQSTYGYYDSNSNTQFIAFTPYFQLIAGAPFYDLAFDTLVDDGTYGVGSTTVSGTCPTDGTNQIALIEDLIGDKQPVLSDFNIDCVDGAWSTTYNFLHGFHQLSLLDKAWLDTPVWKDTPYLMKNIGYVGVDQNDAALVIGYPSCQNNIACNNLQSGNWTFQFQYLLMSGTQSTTVKFIVESGCDSEYENCTGQLKNQYVVDADPYNDSKINVDNVIVDSTQRYYRACLTIGSNCSAPTQAKINFFTLASTASDAAPVKPPPGLGFCLPYLGCVGDFLRVLFVPRQRVMTDLTAGVPAKFQSVAPFNYFFDLARVIKGWYFTPTDAPITLTFMVKGQTVTMPIFDTSNAIVQQAKTAITPALNVLIWFMAFYAIWDIALFCITVGAGG